MVPHVEVTVSAVGKTRPTLVVRRRSLRWLEAPSGRSFGLGFKCLRSTAFKAHHGTL